MVLSSSNATAHLELSMRPDNARTCQILEEWQSHLPEVMKENNGVSSPWPLSSMCSFKRPDAHGIIISSHVTSANLMRGPKPVFQASEASPLASSPWYYKS
jgi:hypothetical protein